MSSSWSVCTKKKMLFIRFKFTIMKFIIIVVCIAYGAAHKYGPAHEIIEDNVQVERTTGQPWPMPQNYATQNTFFSIDPHNFNFLHNTKCDIIIDAVKRYKKLTFIDGCSTSRPSRLWKHPKKAESIGQLFNITIKINNPCESYPYMNMDEQYLLKINTPDTLNQALLYSTTIWGALRGLETFSQLVYPLQPGLFAVNTSIVLDYPRFSFRGLLLDTSRHFIPVPLLLKNLDAMAQTKLNTFHWHIVDNPSFPYVSKKFPDLSQKGAFDSTTHTYSQADVAEVIEYARMRGIRVLAEFDTPGHTLSWGKSQQDLLAACYTGESPNGNFGPIDPTNNKTFTFLKDFFSEVAQVFPDNYMHFGGDEVDFTCWATNPNIKDFMEKHGFGKNYALLEQYYMQKLLDIAKSLNKSYIIWQEVFDNQVKIKPDTVIHVWKGNFESELSNVTAAGYQAILSSCWYLNYISYANDWVQHYNCEPYNFTGTPNQKALVIGGEACMWGEYVDGSNVITRTWPRAAAVAERLWSNQTVNSASKAAGRLEELRCTMIKRGLKVEPVNGPGYCECDYL